MNPDPGSLANLRDLALPPAVSFWPPAPGIWIVLATGLAMGAVFIIRALRRYRANAFRRAAIAELAALAGTSGRDAVEQASAIMKRASIVAFGREHVAALSGREWADFVCRRAGPGVDERVVRGSLQRAFEGASAPDAPAFIEQAKRWVSRLDAREERS